MEFAIFDKEIDDLVTQLLLIMDIIGSLITVVATLVAAFGGAWFAFKLQNSKEEGKENIIRKTALLKALTLIHYNLYNLLHLKRSILEEYENDPGRAINCPTIKFGVTSMMKQDIDSLCFLPEINQTVLLSEIIVEQHRVAVAIAAVERRGDFNREILNPALASANFEFNTKYPIDIIEQNLPKDIIERANHYTDQMYNHIYEVVDSLEDIFFKLEAVATERYPDYEFPSIQGILNKQF